MINLFLRTGYTKHNCTVHWPLHCKQVDFSGITTENVSIFTAAWSHQVFSNSHSPIRYNFRPQHGPSEPVQTALIVVIGLGENCILLFSALSLSPLCKKKKNYWMIGQMFTSMFVCAESAWILHFAFTSLVSESNHCGPEADIYKHNQKANNSRMEKKQTVHGEIHPLKSEVL